mmetsp:Transcript_33667/g.96666  ORF Transcript_33667/g.96666 Transcript_33667/m.96666 type:complete len:397 (+) Transcript_33667:87-1277(+)
MDVAAILKRRGSSSRLKSADDLPPGWVRVESRSKPGAVFYAHPATKRTQVEKPTLKRTKPPSASVSVGADVGAGASTARSSRPSPTLAHAQSARPGMALGAAAKRPGTDADAVVDLDSPGEDPEERRRRLVEEAEAEERARAEAFQRARERRVKELQAARELSTQQADHEDSEELAVSREAPAPKSPGAPPRRVALAASMAVPADAATAKRRRKAWSKEGSQGSEDEAVTKEDIERWRIEEEQRELEERARREEAERLERELAAKQVEEEEGEQPELADNSEASACEGGDGDPCLDVMKDGAWVERHVLCSSKKRWLLGRAANSVDIPMQHDSVSRQHAALIRRGDTIYVADLGSAHGSTLNGAPLQSEVPTKLSAGDRLVFGASTRTYIYRDVGH